MTEPKPNLLAKIARFCESISAWTGRLAMWLTLAMVLVIILAIVLDNFFSASSLANLYLIKISEMSKYFFGMMFMLGIAYTLHHDQHVRVDIFYRKMNLKQKAIVNFVGTVVFLFPVCLVLLIVNLDYVIFNWNETSKDPGGLPFLYLLKTFLVIMPVLLLIQGLANLINHGRVIFQKELSE